MREIIITEKRPGQILGELRDSYGSTLTKFLANPFDIIQYLTTGNVKLTVQEANHCKGLAAKTLM